MVPRVYLRHRRHRSDVNAYGHAPPHACARRRQAKSGGKVPGTLVTASAHGENASGPLSALMSRGENASIPRRTLVAPGENTMVLHGAFIALGENTMALHGASNALGENTMALHGAFVALWENTMALLGVCFPRRRPPSASSPGVLPHLHAGTDHIFLTVRVLPW